MTDPVIQLTNINKSFSGFKVLSNINLTVNAGEILCLVGENGCGKSTLIKIISGVYEADEGRITLNGRYYPSLIPTDSIKEGIHVIYQDFSVFPNLSVAENIALGTQLVQGRKFIDWPRIRDDAARSLELIGVNIDLDEEVGKLPVAQKQIVAISRAILQDARLIIMDEPTTALTQKEIMRLYTIIDNLSRRGIAVIFVSHKLDEVFRISRRIAVIRNGEMVVDERVENFQKEKLVSYMTGQEIEVEAFHFFPKGNESVLRVENLTIDGAFYDVSFDLLRGEILGTKGQLGSVRAELAKGLLGILKTPSGRIFVNGKPVKFRSIQGALAEKIAYVPEDRLTEGLFMNRSVTDNVNAAIVDSMTRLSFLIDEKKMVEEAEKQIAELSVKAPSVDVLANTFSGGNQQRIVMAKWLATRPEILILNGPTVGVDVKSKSEIHRIVKSLAHEGFAVIMISDDIGELLTTTNRIIVMNSGRMIYETNTAATDSETLESRITE